MIKLLSHTVVLRIGFLIALIGAWLPSEADASNLPQCSGNYWHNCQGSCQFADGDTIRGELLVGEFKNHKLNGQGTFLTSNGDKYVATWKDWRRMGLATVSYANGDTFSGIYIDDKRYGQGTYIWKDGSKYVGQWADGVPIEDDRHTSANGTVLRNVKYTDVATYLGNGSMVTADVLTYEAPTVSDKKQKNNPEAAEGSSGTAFRIAAGQFVTNHHVVENCKTMVVGGKQGGSVLEIDPKNDLALISVPNDSGETASIRTTRTVLNEAVTAAGFPLQGAFSGIAITNGTVSRLSGLQGDTGQIQISAPVQPGNSGGPLIDSAGNVIGVVSGKLNALKVADAIGDIPQNINFAIGGNILRAFLDAKGISYKEASRGEDLRGEKIAALASSFTVLVECK